MLCETREGPGTATPREIRFPFAVAVGRRRHCRSTALLLHLPAPTGALARSAWTIQIDQGWMIE